MTVSRTLKLLCGKCHWDDLLATGRGLADLLALLDVGPPFVLHRLRRRGANEMAAGPWTKRLELLTTRMREPQMVPSRWSPEGRPVEFVKVGGYGIPQEGLRLRCRNGCHRINLTETELRNLVEKLPVVADVLYLPAAG